MYWIIGILAVVALLGDCAVISENQHRLQRGYNNNNKNGGYGSYGEGSHGQSGYGQGNYGQGSYGQGGYRNSDERDSHNRDGCSDDEDGGRSDSSEVSYGRQGGEHRHTPSSRSLVKTPAAASNQKHRA
ncbi:hypothetical protein JYU34_003649 [Plutella xylostella]|uniref:Uncharacterized protein n=1 Tax=Plutella xylostella TaxID=51655 RepID=A0ABQ7R0J7_PLUXY|nr:hypothetical protein JYU34_003649 [Plutella xylostella]